MASLKNIKLKIVSVKKTATVTRAMEAVSAVKMRKSQERALGSRSYAAAALSILERLSGTADVARHPLLRENGASTSLGVNKTCIVIITSDKGLAGSLNSGVIRKAEQEIASRSLNKQNACFVAFGRRGADYFASRGWDVRARYENVADGISETDIRAATDQILAWHSEGGIGTALVVYQNFVSTFEQQPSVRQLVPITSQMIQQFVAGIRPARGKYAPQNPQESVRPAAYTIEPDADAVLSQLLPRLLNMAIFHAALERKASEHSARMVEMKSATDKAKGMSQSLTRTYNKIRQAAITREVSEITSGMEAMR